jgi:hypothetical protein
MKKARKRKLSGFFVDVNRSSREIWLIGDARTDCYSLPQLATASCGLRQ